MTFLSCPQYGIYLVSRKQHEILASHFLCSSVLVIFEKVRILYNKNQNKNDLRKFRAVSLYRTALQADSTCQLKFCLQ